MPPLLLDVLLQLDPEGSVVPRRARAAVDLSGREDETTALAQIDDTVESAGRGQGTSSPDLVAVPSPAGMESSALGYRPSAYGLGGKAPRNCHVYETFLKRDTPNVSRSPPGQRIARRRGEEEGGDMLFVAERRRSRRRQGAIRAERARASEAIKQEADP